MRAREKGRTQQQQQQQQKRQQCHVTNLLSRAPSTKRSFEFIIIITKKDEKRKEEIDLLLFRG